MFVCELVLSYCLLFRLKTWRHYCWRMQSFPLLVSTLTTSSLSIVFLSCQENFIWFLPLDVTAKVKTPPRSTMILLSFSLLFIDCFLCWVMRSKFKEIQSKVNHQFMRGLDCKRGLESYRDPFNLPEMSQIAGNPCVPSNWTHSGKL